MAQAIQHASLAGQLVYKPFLGAGLQAEWFELGILRKLADYGPAMRLPKISRRTSGSNAQAVTPIPGAKYAGE